MMEHEGGRGVRQWYKAAERQQQRALVLGSGFIGKAVASSLRGRGMVVESLGRTCLDLTSSTASERLASLLDSETALFFTSAVTPDRDRSDSARQTNSAMVDSVAGAMDQAPPACLVFFSSTSVYGEAEGDRVLTEDTPLRPQGDYAVGKMQAEQELAEVAARRGIPLLILRPSLVYGPGDSHRQYGPSILVRGWLRGEVFLYGEGDDERDFVYVDDVARATADLVSQGATGVYNVGGGSASFRGILEILQKLDPRPVRIITRPRKLPFSRVSVDTSRLHRVFPKHPQVSLEEGLLRTLRS